MSGSGFTAFGGSEALVTEGGPAESRLSEPLGALFCAAAPDTAITSSSATIVCMFGSRGICFARLTKKHAVTGMLGSHSQLFFQLLFLGQRRIVPISGDKLIVRPEFHDAAAYEDSDLIGIPRR